MSGTVLYELHMHGENMLLLAVVSALFGILFGCFMWSLHTAGSHKRSGQIFGKFAVPLVMAFAAVLLVYGTVLKDYWALKARYNSGNCRQAEGVVTEYRQGRNGRQT